MEVMCDLCSYVWDYGGNSKVYVTCPQCMGKTKIEQVRKEVGGV